MENHIVSDSCSTALTVLRCMPDHQGTKTFAPDENGGLRLVRNYDAGYLFQFLHPKCQGLDSDLARLLAPSNIHEMYELLHSLEDEPRNFVVRGEPIEPPSLEVAQRRLLHPDLERGDQATLRAESRSFMVIDVDGLSILDTSMHHPEQAARTVIDAHIPELRGMTVLYRPSASAGVKPGIRMHLVVWLAEPYADSRVKGFLKSINERAGITAEARKASPVLWLDNLPRYHALGMPALDQALTSRRWNDRVLGVSETFSGVLRMTFVATGNNIRVRAETGRRVVPIKLKTLMPNPEQRTGFLHEDLRKWVAENRPRLFAAVLVLLRAALQAGARPSSSYGGFVVWNATIRAAIQYHWGLDPLARQIEFRSRSDDDVETFERLVFAISRIGRRVTVSEMLEIARSQKVSLERGLCDAIGAACPALNGELPSPKALANVLHEYVERPTREYTCLRVNEGRSRYNYWFVTPAFRDEPVPPEAATSLCAVVNELFGDRAFDVGEAIKVPAVQDAVRVCVPGHEDAVRAEMLSGLLRTADAGEWACLETDAGGMWSVQRRKGGMYARIT